MPGHAGKFLPELKEILLAMTEKTINLAEYVAQTAQLLNLPLTLASYPGVVENFTRITAIAQLVTEFPIPDEIEAAPVFEP